MDFSQVIKGAGPLVRSSPNGKYLAVPDGSGVAIFDAHVLQVVRHCAHLDEVTCVEWSPDSEFLLVALYKRGIVNVWSLHDESWTAKIDEGQAGLAAARFAPSGREIVTTSCFELRVTIWSLITGATIQILYPKFSARRGLAFSPDGSLMALARRADCRDVLALFSTSTWEEVGSVASDTADLAGLVWSPNNAYIAVWDSCLEYRVAIYSRDLRPLYTFTAYEHALGVRAVAWSPSSQFLAVASYDLKLRLLNHLTWTPLAEFRHSETVDAAAAIVYREEIEAGEVAPLGSLAARGASRYVLHEGAAVDVPRSAGAAAAAAAAGKLGAGLVEWSADGAFVATRNDGQDKAVWVWEAATLSLASVLLQASEVKSIAWDPAAPRLAIAAGGDKVFFWSPSGASCVQVPADGFRAVAVEWAATGEYLLLANKSAVCCCFPALEGPADGEEQ